MLARHFNSIASRYHNSWCQQPNTAYEQWCLQNILSRFASDVEQSVCKFVDLGGGTGRYTELIVDNLQLQEPAICVDLNENMLAQLALGQQNKITPVCADFLEFTANYPANSVDRVLINCAIHNIPVERVETLYNNIYRILRPKGVLLTVTRPQIAIEYPFFAAAKHMWAANQPDSELYVEALQIAGYQNITQEIECQPMQVPMAEWIHFVAARVWSTFAVENFSRSELLSGIQEICQNYGNKQDNTVNFTEKMIYLAARK